MYYWQAVKYSLILRRASSLAATLSPFHAVEGRLCVAARDQEPLRTQRIGHLH